MMPSRVPSRVLALVPVISLLLLVAPAPTGATGAAVSVQDFSFTPASVTVGLGESVTWSFHAMHTTTSNQRFWDSGARSSGSYTVGFRDAGTFGYHCSMHPSMTGRVRVPLRAGGSAAQGWVLRWSTRTRTPASRSFDVQVKRVGTTTWTWFRRNTARRSGFFDPARHGSYLVRARAHHVGVGTSGWSPRVTVSVS